MLAHTVKIISTSYTPALLYPPSSPERRLGRSWWHSRRRPYRGALVGMGIPEYEAKRYEGKVKDGNILMSVIRRWRWDLLDPTYQLPKKSRCSFDDIELLSRVPFSSERYSRDYSSIVRENGTESSNTPIRQPPCLEQIFLNYKTAKTSNSTPTRFEWLC